MKNCWEFKGCGRQKGGKREKELGACPAAVECKLNGIHKGTNAGRACWIVAGTMCGGKVQGSFAEKFADCTACDFYSHVKNEETVRFKTSGDLMALIRGR